MLTEAERILCAAPIGAIGKCELVIEPEQPAAKFKIDIPPAVLGTLIMVLILENAALEAVRPYLEQGESCVGTHVDAAHLAATPVNECGSARRGP
ncbi:MAG TPA: hypothetical protein VJN41_03435 [Alphaproteobacteria bacterium]|nr:hypothetical protein [Alphaproteobacteria bacterium]